MNIYTNKNWHLQFETIAPSELIQDYAAKFLSVVFFLLLSIVLSHAQSTVLEVYDAPYPGGNLVDSVTAGRNYYVRVAYTDSTVCQDYAFSSENIISTSADGARVVFAIDIDGDGDIDVLSASDLDDKIAWYENNGSENFTEDTISISADGVQSVFAIDMDGDGDIDVLSASELDNKIAWYENDGSENFTEDTISISADGAQSVFAIDMDGDGDIDVLSASKLDDKIAWYENDGNEIFTEDTISISADGAQSVFAIDMDGDGDIDVLSASELDDKIAWYENDGNEVFTEHVISSLADGAVTVYPVDMDVDGDIDILAVSLGGNNFRRVVWFENDGDEIFTEHFIASPDAPNDVFALDVDGDCDADVLYTGYHFAFVILGINNGGDFSTRIDVTLMAIGAMSVYALDVDGDGDIDVLSASALDDKIAWYEGMCNQFTCANTDSVIIDITLPSGSSSSVTLTNSLGTCPKINEYAWVAPASTGNATFVASAYRACGVGSVDDTTMVNVNAPTGVAITDKSLYLSSTLALDRHDPVYSNDVTTAVTDALSGYQGGDESISDDFSSGDYTGGMTTTPLNDWISVWVERDISGTNFQVSGGVLLTTESTSVLNGGGANVYREVNLVGVSAATLSFDITSDMLSGSDRITVQASNDGGANYMDLVVLSGGATTPQSHDLIAALGTVSVETRIRFIWTARGNSSSGQMAFDNISIAATLDAAGDSVITFIQSNTLCSDLIITSGETISIMSYATMIAGSLPVTPDVDAKLEYGVGPTTLIDITSSPTWDGSKFTWMGTLGSDVTIPSGEAISLVITPNDQDVAFTIDYDSQSKPSKVILSVSTAITVENITIYDAAYPGGSVVTDIDTGDVVYLRSTASDPFGYTDITGLHYAITDPNTSSSLVAASSVDNTSCSHTYEYTWTIPDDPIGEYSILAETFEGTEGASDTMIMHVLTSYTSLPIELLYLKAVKNNQRVELSWATASEVNNDYFELQRSKDGITFEAIAKIIGAKTTNMLIQYQHNDNLPLSGVSYYRLKQFDLDGTFSFSDIVSVNFSYSSLVIYPNPTKGQLIINNLDFKHVNIFSTSQMVIRSVTTNNQVIDVSNIPPGVYFIQVNTDYESHVQKFIKY